MSGEVTPLVVQLTEAPLGKNFSNQKIHQKSFKGRDLTNSDFRGAAVIGCDFSNADLSYAKFEGANCWEANFTDAKLYRTNFKDACLAKAIFKPKDCFGVTLTMCCDTFDRMQVDSKWQTVWLFMALMMDLPDKKLEEAIINV